MNRPYEAAFCWVALPTSGVGFCIGGGLYIGAGLGLYSSSEKLSINAAVSEPVNPVLWGVPFFFFAMLRVFMKCVDALIALM